MSTTIAPYPAYDGTQACADADPEIFFPVTSRQVYYSATRLKEICEACPFQRPCLAYALTHQVHGFWAGTSKPQRAEIRKQYGIEAVEVSLPDTKALEAEVARMEQGGGVLRLRTL